MNIGVGFMLLLMAVACSIGISVSAESVSMNELFNNQNDQVPTFSDDAHQGRGLKFLVSAPQTILDYHLGPLLTGQDIPIYIIWYGSFTDNTKTAVRDWLSSFNYSVPGTPTVSSWWNLTSGYKDNAGVPVAQHMSFGGELDDPNYSLGQVLNDSDVALLVVRAINSSKFPSSVEAVYVVMTDVDVNIVDFCMYSCASHASTNPATTPGGKQYPYAWVADSEKQCPGKCSWPFAKEQYGPNTPALVPPNADVGTDGMIINLASVLSGALSNPFDTGYYQGDASAPLEAATACAGIFGQDAYSGYPGVLMIDKITGASYNTEGVNDRQYLMPALWDANTRTCTPAA